MQFLLWMFKSLIYFSNDKFRSQFRNIIPYRILLFPNLSKINKRNKETNVTQPRISMSRFPLMFVEFASIFLKSGEYILVNDKCFH